MSESRRLRLPLLAAAQAQKHVTVNEALVTLDTLVQLAAIRRDLSAPPSTPEEGDTYIVAGTEGDHTATGAWLGWEGRVTRFIDGGWRSYLPGQGGGAGWLAWIIDEERLVRFDGSEWAEAGIPGPPGPQGGPGPQGDPGSGVTWRGAWDPAAQYEAADAVGHDGSSWIANAASQNREPGADPEWDLWVARGEQGEAGDTGPPGEPGEPGDPGPPGQAGADGANWHAGPHDPDSALGAVGDFYLQTGTGTAGNLGDVWLKTGGGWSLVANIRGASGAGTGDVIGPEGGVANGEIAVFDGATGKAVRGGGADLPALLDRASHTGTQTLATISDAGSAAGADLTGSVGQLFDAGAARAARSGDIRAAMSYSALAISAGETPIDLAAGRKFALDLNGDTEIQLPTSCAVGDEFELLITAGDSDPTPSFAAGYVGDDFSDESLPAVLGGDGERTRLHCTVLAVSGTNATEVQALLVAAG